MPLKQLVSVEYSRLADDQELIAQEAGNELAHHGMCKVLRHRVSTHVEYLIELPNGERRWVSEYQD